MKFEKRNVAKKQIFYMRQVGPYGEENYKHMATFKEMLKRKNLLSKDSIILGIPLDNPQYTKAEACRYDVGLIIESSIDPSSERVLEGGYYLYVTVDHTKEAIIKLYQDMSKILYDNHVTYDLERPIIEEYAISDLNQNQCKICIPILE